MASRKTAVPPPTIDWTGQLADQLDWHWNSHLRPRLAGLIDAELHWEPVAGCWGIRPRDEAWMGPVRRLTHDELVRPVGGPWAEAPMASLAEVLLLRDLYRASGGGRLA